MHTGFPSANINHRFPEGSAHVFPHQEQEKSSKDASLVQVESCFITISGLPLSDVSICMVEVTTDAAINTFLKQSPRLSILPNSRHLSTSIILLLLLWLTKWGHVTSQKTSFEKHQETIISALLFGTEVSSQLPRTVLATSLNQHPLQTANVSKKHQTKKPHQTMPQMKKKKKKECHKTSFFPVSSRKRNYKLF